MNNNGIQALIDGMNMQDQRERSGTQMTLGQIIDELKKLPLDTEIKGLGALNSYRGYYSDLAFEPSNKVITAKDLLNECVDAMGKVFIGYKGGEFVMGSLTPLWLASYGCTGEKIMGINKNNTIETVEDD